MLTASSASGGGGREKPTLDDKEKIWIKLSERKALLIQCHRDIKNLWFAYLFCNTRAKTSTLASGIGFKKPLSDDQKKVEKIFDQYDIDILKIINHFGIIISNNEFNFEQAIKQLNREETKRFIDLMQAKSNDIIGKKGLLLASRDQTLFKGMVLTTEFKSSHAPQKYRPLPQFSTKVKDEAQRIKTKIESMM